MKENKTRFPLPGSRNKNTESVLGRFSTEIAMVSFGIGTVLLGIHFLNPESLAIYVTGALFVLLAVFVNTIILVHLLYQFIIKRELREYFAIKILIMLSNIPVAIFYGYAAFYL